MGKLAGPLQASLAGEIALAGVGATSHHPSEALDATISTLNPFSGRSPMQADLSRGSQAEPDLSRRSQTKAAGQPVSVRKSQTGQSAWGRLSGVQFLRSDPFYARLVNTYLFANAVWVLVIDADFSNRFAYLSWFMMPWVLLYPFVPGKINDRPRFGMIAATLCAQFSFSYLMDVVVYPLRGIQ
jgi:hypothetical protein